jgi:hypothetical protein
LSLLLIVSFIAVSLLYSDFLTDLPKIDLQIVCPDPCGNTVFETEAGRKRAFCEPIAT